MESARFVEMRNEKILFFLIGGLGLLYEEGREIIR